MRFSLRPLQIAKSHETFKITRWYKRKQYLFEFKLCWSLVKFQRRSIYKFTIHINRLFPLESCFPDHHNLKFYNPSPFLLLKQSKYSKSFRIVLFFHKSQVDATQTAILLFSNFNMTLKRLEMIFAPVAFLGATSNFTEINIWMLWIFSWYHRIEIEDYVCMSSLQLLDMNISALHLHGLWTHNRAVLHCFNAIPIVVFPFHFQVLKAQHKVQ